MRDKLVFDNANNVQSLDGRVAKMTNVGYAQVAKPWETVICTAIAASLAESRELKPSRGFELGETVAL